MHVLKHAVATVALAMATIAAYAQEASFQNVDTWKFSGVRSAGGKAFYTFYGGDKTENKGVLNYKLELLSPDLQPLKTVSLDMGKGARLANSTYSDGYYLFIFTDASAKSLTRVVIDEQGNVVKRDEQTGLKYNLLQPEDYEHLLSAGGGEFVLVRPVKEKAYGYQIERFDAQLNQKFAKTYLPAKGNWTIKESGFANNTVYVLVSESNKLLETVVAVDARSGEEKYQFPLDTEKTTGYATFFRPDPDGSLITGGMYFQGHAFNETNSEGLFFTVLDAQGKPTAQVRTAWKDIQSKIADEFSGALIGGKTKLLVEDVVRTADGNYTVVSESWRKSSTAMTGQGAMRMAAGLGTGSASNTNTSGQKEIGFTIMDFVLFKFDRNGTLLGMQKLDQRETEMVLRGPVAERYGLDIAMYLYRNGYFSYKYPVEQNGKTLLMYTNWDGMKQYAFFMPVDNPATKGLPALDLTEGISEQSNKMNKMGAALNGPNKVTVETSPTANLSGSRKTSGLIPAGNGKMLTYALSNGTLRMRLMPIPE